MYINTEKIFTSHTHTLEERVGDMPRLFSGVKYGDDNVKEERKEMENKRVK